MKKLIAMAVAILLTACIAAFASGKNKSSMPRKQFNYQRTFSKIVVEDDIDLQLVENENKIIEFTGMEADVENTDWRIKGDVLFLRSKKGSLKDKVKITINVTQLKEIVIRGKSKVSSAGSLLSPNLYVYMEDACYVAIKNTGQINVVRSYYVDVDVETKVGNVRVSR